MFFFNSDSIHEWKFNFQTYTLNFVLKANFPSYSCAKIKTSFEKLTFSCYAMIGLLQNIIFSSSEPSPAKRRFQISESDWRYEWFLLTSLIKLFGDKTMFIWQMCFPYHGAFGHCWKQKSWRKQNDIEWREFHPAIHLLFKHLTEPQNRISYVTFLRCCQWFSVDFHHTRTVWALIWQHWRKIFIFVHWRQKSWCVWDYFQKTS